MINLQYIYDIYHLLLERKTPVFEPLFKDGFFVGFITVICTINRIRKYLLIGTFMIQLFSQV